MNKIIKIAFPAVLALGLSTQVCAYHNNGAGFYIGGEIGGSNLHYQNTKLAQGTYQVDDKGWAGRLIAGFDINHNVGVELGYTSYQNPKFKYTNTLTTLTTDFSQQSFDVLGKVSLPLTCNVGLFAKGGLAYVHRDDFQATLGNVTIKHHAADDHVRPMLGVGVCYGFNSRVTGDLGYYRTFGADDLEDADFYGAGITVKVG